MRGFKVLSIAATVCLALSVGTIIAGESFSSTKPCGSTTVGYSCKGYKGRPATCSPKQDGANTPVVTGSGGNLIGGAQCGVCLVTSFPTYVPTGQTCGGSIKDGDEKDE